MLAILDRRHEETPNEKSVRDYIRELGISGTQAVSESELASIVIKTIKSASQSDIALYKAGKKPRVKKWLIGQVMKTTRGSIAPEIVEQSVDKMCPID